jgi:GntR family transcriptional regulator / MocR family aminotransferase
MRIPIDRESEMPVYRQIETFFLHGISTGSLKPGMRLPASRALGADLGINRLTIEKAYSELEAKGLVYSRIGSGTYVSPQHEFEDAPFTENGKIRLPVWQGTVLQQKDIPAALDEDSALIQAGHARPISFSTGIGDANLFPVDDFRKVLSQVLRRDGINALDYGEKAGYQPLRETIAQILASQGLHTRAERILITGGSQQAIALVSQILLKPGDTVLVEKPTYGGALNLFRSLEANIIGIPVDENGMQVERLEKMMKIHHPNLIYTIPNFQNPTGACMSGQRRRMLITLADQYNVPILEDDFVGDLRYEGFGIPALKALDPGGRVIYISTFSKMVMPGLRMGYIVTEEPLLDTLINWKVITDLASSSLIQRALQAYVTVGRYQAHLRRAMQMYGKRCESMIRAIHKYMPVDVRFTRPQGGLFIWLTLPDSVNVDELFALACKNGISFTIGRAFYDDAEEGKHNLRLNFVAQPPEKIEEGIQRLADCIRQLM